MRIYLVGGAVRDALLGLKVRERDWVVVGATPQAMIDQAYKPVGKDFPVFLHPRTGEEYALARTERKSGHGYHGFEFHTGTEVTLEQDLSRRDLSINAIAQSEDGALIDPCGGRQDLESRTLRHVSPAFAEDPLRVLRVARFAARYAPFGFRIADETLALMQGMVNQGEVDHLVPERIWKETERALMQSDQAHAEGVPSVYFRVLHQCGALARVMPELADLHGVPQRPEHHPEVDTLLHTLLSLDVTAKAGEPLEVRVAALLHDLGKALTPPEQWPRHIAHEHRGLPRVKQFCERLRVPNAARDLAMIVAAEHLLVHRCQELRPDTLLKLLERCDALRRPQRFEQVLAACRADARGRSGREQDAYPQAEYLRAAAHAAQVDPQSVIADGFGGADIGVEIRKRRLVRLKRFVAERS